MGGPQHRRAKRSGAWTAPPASLRSWSALAKSRRKICGGVGARDRMWDTARAGSGGEPPARRSHWSGRSPQLLLPPLTHLQRAAAVKGQRDGAAHAPSGQEGAAGAERQRRGALRGLEHGCRRDHRSAPIGLCPETAMAARGAAQGPNACQRGLVRQPHGARPGTACIDCAPQPPW